MNIIGQEVLLKKDVREKSKGDLYWFAKTVLNKNLLKVHLHKPMCNFVQMHPEGYFPYDNIKRDYGDWKTLRKVLWLHRAGYKSTICSIAFPLWLLINNPNLTIALVSANDKNTKKWLREIKEIILYNKFFRWAFDEIRRGDKWDEKEIIITRDERSPQASVSALSINEGLASQHFDYIILDDAVNEQTAQSAVEMAKAVELFQYLEDIGKEIEKTGFMVVGTPWGVDDVLAEAKKQAQAGNRVMWGIGALGGFQISDSLKGNKSLIPRFTEGQPILPHACGWTKLNKIKKENRVRFIRQYLCDPFAEEANGFQLRKIREYNEYPDGTIKCRCHEHHSHHLSQAAVVAVSDPAYTEDKANCESSILLAAKFSCGCRFLLEEWGDQVHTLDYEEKACEIANRNKLWLQRFGIESVNFQLALANNLKYRKEKGEFPLNVELPEKGNPAFLMPKRRDKDARISSQISPVNSGQWHIRPSMSQNHNTDKPNLMEQLYRWPFSRKRDRADAFGYFDDCWEGLSGSNYIPEDEVDINAERQREDMALMKQDEAYA